MPRKWPLLLGAIVLSACGADDGATSAPPNIILISLDTVRADHLSLYGYSRPTSPNLDEFARSATLYSRAHTTAPWTLSAHASLFTGLYPSEHGAEMIRFEPDANPDLELPLPPGALTLAEVLGEVGYRTASISSNLMYLVPRYGLHQGFEHFETLKGRGKKAPARGNEVNARTQEWVEEVLADPDGRPFFLFINYMDAHTPYNTTPRPGFLEDTPPFSHRKRKFHEARVNGGKPGVPRAILERTIDQYDLSIANLDDSLGQFFAFLRDQDLFEDALIMVVSDHGEYLGEHDLLGHAKDVYEGAMRVPLIVKAPKQVEARQRDELISLVHLPYMILELAGLEERVAGDPFPYRWPEDQIEGQMRYSLWIDIQTPWGARFDRVRAALYDGRHKFIHSSDGNHELYDLEADPDEIDNLLLGSPHLAATWAGRFAAIAEKERRQPPEPDLDAYPEVDHELSEEDREKLRAMGYIE